MRGHLLNAVLALVFSFLIWSAVGAQLVTQGRVRIDLEVEVPSDVIVSYQGKPSTGETLLLRDAVTISVRGPKEQIERLGQAGLVRGRVVLDRTQLQDALRTGTLTVIPLEHVFVSDPLEKVSATPSKLELIVSRVVAPAVWVEPGELIGQPAPGYRVGDVSLNLNLVKVRGAASVLKQFPGTQDDPYRTEPIDITGARRSFKVERSVMTPEGVVALDGVQAQVEIVPVLVDEEVEFPIRVLRLPPKAGEPLLPLPYKVETRDGWVKKVKLSGPKAVLESLKKDLNEVRLTGRFSPDIPAAYILASDMDHLGEDVLDIYFTGLPEGVRPASTATFWVKLLPGE